MGKEGEGRGGQGRVKTPHNTHYTPQTRTYTEKEGEESGEKKKKKEKKNKKETERD
jgi:hypothetical protein